MWRFLVIFFLMVIIMAKSLISPKSGPKSVLWVLSDLGWFLIGLGWFSLVMCIAAKIK